MAGVPRDDRLPIGVEELERRGLLAVPVALLELAIILSDDGPDFHDMLRVGAP